MFGGATLWILVTVLATGAQTARNAMQGALVGAIGSAGATQVRFIYGFPFACVFFLAVMAGLGAGPVWPNASFFLYALGGGVAQIFGTAMMLIAISQRSFATGIAYTKVEPVLVALFGVIVLGEHPGAVSWLGIVVASVGVALMSAPRRRAGEAAFAGVPGAAWRAPLAGVASAALFAISAVAFRAAILSLGDGHFVLRASQTLVVSLGLQSLLLGLWLSAFDRAAFIGSLRVWRASLTAGFMGALASQFWFIGFALTSAANVRTLALLEVLFAQAVSRRVFRETLSWREMAGAAMVVIGVATLLSTWRA